MNEVVPGARVEARTADNQRVHLRAATGVTQGADFPVVWLLEEERWMEAIASGARPEDGAIPWPAEDVRAEDEEVSN